MASYTKKEFRHLCIQCGYASSAVVTEFFKRYPKDEYTDDDFIKVNRLDSPYAGIKRTTKRKNS